MAVKQGYTVDGRARRQETFADIEVICAHPLAGAYHSSKYAVESINEAMRFELRSFGIRVITLQPGPVSTTLAHTAAESLKADPDNPYFDMVKAFHRTAKSNMGYLSPDVVAKVVICAITARNPRARYKIGMMAHMLPLGAMASLKVYIPSMAQAFIATAFTQAYRKHHLWSDPIGYT